MKGKLENIGEINAVSSGSGKKGPWTLWSTKLTVDGNDYGYSDFDKKVLEDKVSKLKQGSIVEFETEERGEYTNVKKNTDIKVLEEGTGQAGPAAPIQAVPKLTDEEIEKLWKDTADFVNDYWKQRKIVVDTVDLIGPSINTIYMAKCKVRGIR